MTMDMGKLVSTDHISALFPLQAMLHPTIPSGAGPPHFRSVVSQSGIDQVLIRGKGFTYSILRHNQYQEVYDQPICTETGTI